MIVHTKGAQTRVETADPQAMMRLVANPALDRVAQEARDRLARVLDRLKTGG